MNNPDGHTGSANSLPEALARKFNGDPSPEALAEVESARKMAMHQLLDLIDKNKESFEKGSYIMHITPQDSDYGDIALGFTLDKKLNILNGLIHVPKKAIENKFLELNSEEETVFETAPDKVIRIIGDPVLPEVKLHEDLAERMSGSDSVSLLNSALLPVIDALDKPASILVIPNNSDVIPKPGPWAGHGKKNKKR